MSSPTKIIDSHLHIWATEEESKSTYPYVSIDQTPPPSLINNASPKALIEQMQSANVDGTLIVQPINHKFDHSYVIHAMKEYPNLFKGMLLYDPNCNDQEKTIDTLEDLVLKGFVGVRFNPYLWDRDSDADDSEDGDRYMSKGYGLEVYKRCGELNIPVGIMCFKGLDLHYNDIIELLTKSPKTTMILDHFGFTALGETENTTKSDLQWEQLLSLAKYENVIIKISALFRVAGGHDPYPYDRVKKERFDVLLETFGKDRLMFGTDFPFVLNEDGGYKGTVDLVKSWTDSDESVQNAVMYGTAERLFGVWGSVVDKK